MMPSKTEKWNMMEILESIMTGYSNSKIKVDHEFCQLSPYLNRVMVYFLSESNYKSFLSSHKKSKSFLKDAIRYKISVKPSSNSLNTTPDWLNHFPNYVACQDRKKLFNESESGCRPDSIYLVDLPGRWFDIDLDTQQNQFFTGASKIKSFFSQFGKIKSLLVMTSKNSENVVGESRAVHRERIAVKLSPTRTQHKNDLLSFDVYVQFSCLDDFERALNELESSILIYNKVLSKKLDVKFDIDGIFSEEGKTLRRKKCSDALQRKKEIEEQRMKYEVKLKDTKDDIMRLVLDAEKKMLELENVIPVISKCLQEISESDSFHDILSDLSKASQGKEDECKATIDTIRREYDTTDSLSKLHRFFSRLNEVITKIDEAYTSINHEVEAFHNEMKQREIKRRKELISDINVELDAQLKKSQLNGLKDSINCIKSEIISPMSLSVASASETEWTDYLQQLVEARETKQHWSEMEERYLHILGGGDNLESKEKLNDQNCEYQNIIFLTLLEQSDSLKSKLHNLKIQTNMKLFVKELEVATELGKVLNQNTDIWKQVMYFEGQLLYLRNDLDTYSSRSLPKTILLLYFESLKVFDEICNETSNGKLLQNTGSVLRDGMEKCVNVFDDLCRQYKNLIQKIGVINKLKSEINVVFERISLENPERPVLHYENSLEIANQCLTDISLAVDVLCNDDIDSNDTISSSHLLLIKFREAYDKASQSVVVSINKLDIAIQSFEKIVYNQHQYQKFVSKSKAPAKVIDDEISINRHDSEDKDLSFDENDALNNINYNDDYKFSTYESGLSQEDITEITLSEVIASTITRPGIHGGDKRKLDVTSVLHKIESRLAKRRKMNESSKLNELKLRAMQSIQRSAVNM